MKTTLFALSFAVLATTVFAQAPQPDFSKVVIKTTKISDNFYTLEGQGGTIGVLVGPDGVFMVDWSLRHCRRKSPPPSTKSPTNRFGLW